MNNTGQDFARQIAAWAAKAERMVTEVARGTALELGKRIIDNTPEDTGLARGNWMCGIGSPDTGTSSAKGADASKARLERALANYDAKDGRSIHISNALPYVPGLEYGTAHTPPHAMVRKATAGFESIVKEQVKKAGGKV